jgi:hypothetical protein
MWVNEVIDTRNQMWVNEVTPHHKKRTEKKLCVSLNLEPPLAWRCRASKFAVGCVLHCPRTSPAPKGVLPFFFRLFFFSRSPVGHKHIHCHSTSQTNLPHKAGFVSLGDFVGGFKDRMVSRVEPEEDGSKHEILVQKSVRIITLLFAQERFALV